MAAWKIVTDETEDYTEIREMFARHEVVVFPPEPTSCTRMEDRNGLLVHRDPELTWFVHCSDKKIKPNL